MKKNEMIEIITKLSLPMEVNTPKVVNFKIELQKLDVEKLETLMDSSFDLNLKHFKGKK